MGYYFSKTLECSFEEAESRARLSIEKQKMGIVAEVDVAHKLNEHLNVNMKRYKILGACSPGHAYRALLEEDKIGVLMPCNVVIIEKEEGKIEVAAMDPEGAFAGVGNQEVKCIGGEMRLKMKNIIEDL
ncbi:MAG: hypothetical protein PWR20_31 [Bacteroidales bacterium]|jgi:uncharacterized protein (DUF302 family)|nr:hypothetical protein [Bacteroidales bacterium]MDN5328606.1 hypothetical protein [Bacteroidales bacterium]